jgi:hypothetical protein
MREACLEGLLHRLGTLPKQRLFSADGIWFAAPPPVDGQDDVPYSVVDVSGDVDNERAEQLLPCAHGDIWRISRGIEIVCKSSKVGWFDGLI